VVADVLGHKGSYWRAGNRRLTICAWINRRSHYADSMGRSTPSRIIPAAVTPAAGSAIALMSPYGARSLATRHVRSQADRGCAFWQREPGSGDG
jgi:hypothetical protein